ncbi:uncharacterized protein [Clinocottus analis]|uniref:uncharacterized protein n=1 Tax=Clinocottus analis TaxID=304258 RepID=UPI0035C0D3EB
MADPEERRRAEEFLRQDLFRRNAFLLIDKMLELLTQASPDVTALVDEILHTIFFLGRIHRPRVTPESIVGNILNDLMDVFPRPFVLYSSELPRRSPFSCVLDMIVHVTGRENETQIIRAVRELISDPELSQSQDLVSSIICVSHRTDVKDPVKYYGVSMSAAGPMSRKIMIAASCLGSWDEYVAGAVMTYFPTKKKNQNFDGTFQLPESVRCQAFDLREDTDKPPCKSCQNLFGLTSRELTEWVYGNCAEVESLSNLFKEEADVKERARPRSTKYSDEGRVKVERLVKTDVTNWLRLHEFIWHNTTFYTPQ